jgi:hypothetical protein
MANIPINVNQNLQGISIVPTRANVTNGPDSVILVWNATGTATFPSTDYFEWKNNPPGAPHVNFKDSTELRSDPYVNNFPEPGVVWAYKIKVSGVWVDPEVNNEPPGHDLY